MNDGGVDIVYSADVALKLLSERIAQLEHDNAILRASVAYYQSLISPVEVQQHG